MAVGRLGIESPASQETIYRRRLRRLSQDSFDILVDDPGASVVGPIAVAIVGYEGVSRGIDRYNQRQIVSTYDDYFRENQAAVLKQLSLEADVSGSLAIARTNNVALITDITDEQRTKIILELAVQEAEESLEARLNEILKSSKTRSKVIARDQTSKINADLSRIRHKAAGATRYNWRTVGDERVRPDHAAVNGDEYAYGETTGVDSGAMPGEDVQCRCVDDPVF